MSSDQTWRMLVARPRQEAISPSDGRQPAGRRPGPPAPPRGRARPPAGAARAAGLEDRVDVLLEDYRDLRGSYDKLVSIEMIEAVGWQHFDEFFSRCDELLAPGGLMFLQAITIGDELYEAEKTTRSFANTHIFPGGCLPSEGLIASCLGRATSMRQ